MILRLAAFAALLVSSAAQAETGESHRFAVVTRHGWRDPGTGAGRSWRRLGVDLVEPGDRVPGVVEWNLFDIDAKYGDVIDLEDALAYITERGSP